MYHNRGVDFGKSDVKIATKIYGYSKGAVDGKFKQPLKYIIKMDKTIRNIATLVPPEIVEHYTNLHLYSNIPFVNNVDFFLAKSRDIRFIHCK